MDVLKDKQLKYELYDNKGFVILQDCMPRMLDAKKQTADYAIAAMARVSYGNIELKSDEDDKKLINRLVEMHHTSPLEGVQFKFVMQIPIYVARQLIRHRTAKVNEYSMRYSKAIDDFYFPPLRTQDKVNKQQSVELKSANNDIVTSYKNACQKSQNLIKEYNDLISKDCAREVARSILPVAEMTKLVWCMDAHNLFKFLKLRCDRSTAQKEIVDLADAIFNLITPIIPVTCEAVKKYWINSATFSTDEMNILCKTIDTLPAIMAIKKSEELNERQKTALLIKLKLSDKAKMLLSH
jgi:thymidylate synthase (FAD)